VKLEASYYFQPLFTNTFFQSFCAVETTSLNLGHAPAPMPLCLSVNAAHTARDWIRQTGALPDSRMTRASRGGGHNFRLRTPSPLARAGLIGERVNRESGEAWPSTERIAQGCALKQSTVVGLVRRLEASDCGRSSV
jgi:hypothetical protein